MQMLLGVKIDNLTESEILQKIDSLLNEKKFFQIATVNPEFILTAQKNPKFKDILNNCDLNVADGVGIKMAFWSHGKKLHTRIAGIDLLLEILKMADQRKLNVFLIANKHGLSNWKETAIAIQKRFLNLTLSGIDVGIDSSVKIDNLKNFDLVFCALGSPRQEIFLNSLKNDILGLTMGVGGSFDFLTEKVKRAPAWMRKIGLEWLWRLILQPQRFKRIFNATVIFPIKVLFSKKSS